MSQDTFQVAERFWGNLKKFDGCHWMCGDNKTALLYNWTLYDAYYFPEAPTLNHRFLRMVVNNDTTDIQETIRLLRITVFYMRICSQALFVSTVPSETIIDLAQRHGYGEAKRVSESMTILHKY